MNTESRSIKDYLILVSKGFAMGASDVVPGVSGGTMAFILGIYEELINSIRAFVNPHAFKLIFTFKLKEAFNTLPWKFLLVLFSGIMLAIFSLAQFLEWMLDNQPSLLWSFFFGLVAASILTVMKRVSQWNAATVGAAIIGGVIAWLIVGMVPAEMSHSPLFLFFSGFIAICAMILPGISGSFILVLLGQYEYILSAVNNRDFVTLIIVAAGAVVGLGTFAQVLGWLFKRYHDLTVAVLIGFMAGSLRKIWPWKETLSTTVDRHGEIVPLEQINVLPDAWTSDVTFAIILAIVGFATVFLIDYIGNRKEAQVEPASA
jgi:putative membrane protein